MRQQGQGIVKTTPRPSGATTSPGFDTQDAADGAEDHWRRVDSDR
jgi:hypothetical protein